MSFSFPLTSLLSECETRGILEIHSRDAQTDIARAFLSSQSPCYFICYSSYSAVLSFTCLFSMNREVTSVMYVTYVITNIILAVSPGTAKDMSYTRF